MALGPGLYNRIKASLRPGHKERRVIIMTYISNLGIMIQWLPEKERGRSVANHLFCVIVYNSREHFIPWPYTFHSLISLIDSTNYWVWLLRTWEYCISRSFYKFMEIRSFTPFGFLPRCKATVHRVIFYLFSLDFFGGILSNCAVVTKNYIAWLAWLSRSFARVHSLFILGSCVSVSKTVYFVIFL